MFLQRLFYQLLTLHGSFSEEWKLLFEAEEAAIMNWASDKSQNQTVLCLGSQTHPGEERGLLKCAGTDSDVSRWEPVDDRFSRRLAFVSLPAVGQKHRALLQSWQRTT